MITIVCVCAYTRVRVCVCLTLFDVFSAAPQTETWEVTETSGESYSTVAGGLQEGTELMTRQVLTHKTRNKMKMTKIEEDKRNPPQLHPSFSCNEFLVMIFFFFLQSFTS